MSGGTLGYTLVARGTDSWTHTVSTNSVTGATSRYEQGNDTYTLSENDTASGGAFTQSVTGAESYTGSFSGNTANQEEVGTLTGAGTWTRTSSGAGSTKPSGTGTNTYSHMTSTNPIAGVFGQTVTGQTRYQLVETFDDVSNANAGANPGHVKFRSHGLMFRDPVLEIEVQQDMHHSRALGSEDASVLMSEWLTSGLVNPLLSRICFVHDRMCSSLNICKLISYSLTSRTQTSSTGTAR
jgi:hypothetical protein